MELAMVGLGKMGANMTLRLLRGGHKVVAFDLNEAAIQQAEGDGAVGARALDEVIAKLSGPRVVWVMVPSGDPTEKTVMAIAQKMSKGDTIIDGGNSNYKESMRRAAAVNTMGVNFVDVGTSGGIWGLTEGYSLMVGGDSDVVKPLYPIFETLAPAANQGWGHVGQVGSGHYTKMVHNGIEYGLMQAYAEGFDLLKHKTEFNLDLAQIAELWRVGSVVRSWLLDLTANALKENPNMEGIAAYVTDSGEGRWTVVEAIDLAVSIPVISMALLNRFKSRDEAPFSDKLLAAMRNQFGGHGVKKV